MYVGEVPNGLYYIINCNVFRL